MPGTTAGERPSYGRVGPADPHADPVTHPVLRPADMDGPMTDPGLPPVPVAPPEAPTVRTAQPEKPPTVHPDSVVRHSRTGGVYVALIFSAIVLIFLLVFILQNLVSVRITFLGFGGSLPVGVALLLAAIAGLLLVAIPGGVRMWQLRQAVRRATKQMAQQAAAKR